MALRFDNTWSTKYPFDGLQIGESVEVVGVEGNIRSSASMWGTRYGIWLQCEKIDDGRIKVTRIDTPVNYKKKKRIDRLEEKIDMLAGLLLKIHEQLKNGYDQTGPH